MTWRLDEFSWPRAVGWGVLAWLALGLAAFADGRQSGDWAWLVGVAPLAVVFLAGIRERQMWWVRGALLALPAVVMVIWVILDVTVGDSAQQAGADMAAGILLVAGPIVLVCSGVALAIVAWLGVLLGRALPAR